MKTEEQIKEKQIEIQSELMNAIEAKNTFESTMQREPTGEENEDLLYKITLLEFQDDVITWVLS